jgi:tRNA1Val (adenine37-N6)-methyltransferase
MKVTTDACLFGAWVAKDAAESGRQIKIVLDIGAGTGLLALMFAQKNELASIDAVEVEQQAAIQGRENFESSPWKNRINLVDINIKDLATVHKYDTIFSNPPFYENELQSPDTRKNIAHHSGGLSLDELLAAMALRLEPGGVFYVLLPYKRNNEMALLFKKHALYIQEKILVSQSTRHDPFRIMLKGSNQESAEMRTNQLSICDDQQQYTEGITELLKDYYLKL